MGYRCEDQEWQYVSKTDLISANEERGFQVKYSWLLKALYLYPVGKNSKIMAWPDIGKFSCLNVYHPQPYLGVASGAGSSGEWNVCGDNVVGLGKSVSEQRLNKILWTFSNRNVLYFF